MNAIIKTEFLNKRVGFGKSFDPFCKRSVEEINDLAIIALESKDKTLLKLFDFLPELQQLKQIRLTKKLKPIVEVLKK